MGKVVAGPLFVLLGAVSSDSEEEDTPAQMRSASRSHKTDNGARNPMAYLHIHVSLW